MALPLRKVRIPCTSLTVLTMVTHPCPPRLVFSSTQNIIILTAFINVAGLTTRAQLVLCLRLCRRSCQWSDCDRLQQDIDALVPGVESYWNHWYGAGCDNSPSTS